MIRHSDLKKGELSRQIKSQSIKFAGNAPLKIYGTLGCRSGKRMKRENRVFFESAADALKEGYRPCGNCMKGDYKAWISLNR